MLTFKNGPGPWWDSRQGRILLLHSWLNDTFKDSKGPTLATAERCPEGKKMQSLKYLTYLFYVCVLLSCVLCTTFVPGAYGGQNTGTGVTVSYELTHSAESTSSLRTTSTLKH